MTHAAPWGAIAVALSLSVSAGCGAHPRRVEGPPPEYELPDEGDAAADDAPRAPNAPNASDASPGVIDSGAAEPPASP